MNNIIKRMINLGYSDDDIVQRLRYNKETVQAVRNLIELENTSSHIEEESNEDWGEE
jgi:hypothetical protein